MTIIVAQKCPLTEEVWIGSDSLMSSGDGYIYPMPTKKWMQSNDGWWIGVAGSNRALNLLAAYFDRWGGKTAFDVANSVRELLREDDWERDDDKGLAPAYKNNYILASKQGVWAIASNFCVSDFVYEFCADGSGYEYAYGAAYALERSKNNDLRHKIVTSIAAAIKYDRGCGGDIFIKKL